MLFFLAFVSNRDVSRVCLFHSFFFLFFFFDRPDNVESAVVDLTELLLLDVIIWVDEAVRALSFYAISRSLTGTLSLSLPDCFYA